MNPFVRPRAPVRHGAPARPTRSTAAEVARRVILVSALVSSACQSGPGADERAAAEAAREKAAQVAREEAAAKKEAAEKAAAEAARRAEEEARKAAEALKQQLSNCCQGLAKRGFTERSMADMAAKKVCLSAVEEEQPLEDVVPSLEEALEERELPVECLTEEQAKAREKAEADERGD